MSPRLVTRPPLMIGRTTQSDAVFGGMFHPVARPVTGSTPVSVSLQSVEPWSNTQLCPPPVSGWAESLCSLTEVSGMKIEPAVPVKTFGEKLAAVETIASRLITKPSAGKFPPLEQTAQAKFWLSSVTVAASATVRLKRPLVLLILPSVLRHPLGNTLVI